MGRRGLWLATVLALGLGGCGGVAEPPTTRAVVDVVDARLLPDPALGYPGALDPVEARELSAARDSLIRSGAVEAALALADRLLGRDPGLQPARVLAAEAMVVDGRSSEAVAELEPVVLELPGYTAAQVVLGLAAEGADDVPRAHEAFRAAAPAFAAAAERAQATRERALEIVSRRLESSLGTGRLSDAAQDLERLERWAPDDARTLESRAALARAEGDAQAELAALRRLAELGPGERELETRVALLELEAGDAGEGLRRFEELSSRFPGDPEIAAGLTRARFLWRLQLLPADVRELVGRPRLNRGETAVLLYWLFPSLRFGATGGRIATDVLDHPQRDAIIRVANAGVLEVDETLHQFDPDRPVTRAEVLAGLLRLLAAADPPAGCVGGDRPGARPSEERVCAAAARCGLLDESSGCLPAGPVSGSWAVERSREALQRLGVE